jgi:hypothetical protein
MQQIQAGLDRLEAFFSEHPLPESLHRITGELDRLTAYARLAEGVDDSVREDLAWTADLARDCWSLMTFDQSAAETTDANRAARTWHLFGSLLDRTQDMIAAKPATLTDLFLDAMSVILPFVGSHSQVQGAIAAHGAAISGVQSRLDEVLWRYFLPGPDRLKSSEAWALVEQKRDVVQRCNDLVFVKTEDPSARTATLVLLFLSVLVSTINRLREMTAGEKRQGAKKKGS